MAIAKEDSFILSTAFGIISSTVLKAVLKRRIWRKIKPFCILFTPLAYSFFFSFAISHTANIPNAAPQQSSKTSCMLFPLFEKI